MQRVIIVHPTYALRTLAADILAAQGFAAIAAEAIDDVAALFATDPPAVAVVDERLVPDLPCLRFPWIALGRPATHASLVAAGAACVVEKPFGEENLLEAVRWVLAVNGAV